MDRHFEETRYFETTTRKINRGIVKNWTSNMRTMRSYAEWKGSHSHCKNRLISIVRLLSSWARICFSDPQILFVHCFHPSWLAHEARALSAVFRHWSRYWRLVFFGVINNFTWKVSMQNFVYKRPDEPLHRLEYQVG